MPTPPTGVTGLKPIDMHSALFMIQQIRAYPGEVRLRVGGPFTTVALALGLDPEIATLAKEMVLMGAGFNVDRGGNHRINGRHEFNWWWDPEAARIAMSAPWKKITITPVDISVKTSLGDDLKKRLAASDARAAQFITKFHPPGQGGGGGYMWDEISVLAFLDPSIITQQQQLYVNIDIDHGASYGQTIFVEAAGGAEHVPAYQVAAKDTTGAGDAFVGSFAVFLGEGLPDREAISRANLYAALSTTAIGTQKSFVTRERFEEEWYARETAKRY